MTEREHVEASDTRGEVTLPPYDVTEDEIRQGKQLSVMNANPITGEYAWTYSQKVCRERQLKSALESNLLLREEIERLKVELVEMTQDRNDWASDHEDDCPNKTLLEFAEQDLATLREENEQLKGWKASALRWHEDAKLAEEWAARWHKVVETVLTINGLSPAMSADEATVALSSTLRASASSDGWIEIKEGCEMPEHDTRVLIYRRAAHRDTEPEYGLQRCYLGEQYPIGRSATHWHPITPPTATNTEKG